MLKKLLGRSIKVEMVKRLTWDDMVRHFGSERAANKAMLAYLMGQYITLPPGFPDDNWESVLHKFLVANTMIRTAVADKLSHLGGRVDALEVALEKVSVHKKEK